MELVYLVKGEKLMQFHSYFLSLFCLACFLFFEGFLYLFLFFQKINHSIYDIQIALVWSVPRVWVGSGLP